jgi:hypothetical protein
VKIILTCGHAHSGYAVAHDILVAAGLVQAQHSKRESMMPAELHEKLLKAHELDDVGAHAVAQLSPGKVWQDLAVDLFMGNLSHQNWGWAEARAIWLLEFWKAFDPQMRFLLVYSSPEFAVGHLLRNKLATAENIKQEMSSWISTNAEILRFYHRNPDRCVLVNASAAIHAPAQLTGKISSAFGIGLRDICAGYNIDRTGMPALASHLAKALIEDCDEAVALYNELESSADLDVSAVCASEAEKQQAAHEYADLLRNLDQLVQEATGHAAQAGRLHQEREAIALKLAKAQLEATELATKLQQSESFLGAAQAQTATITLDGKQLAQGLEQQLANSQREIKELALKLKQAESALDVAQSETAKADSAASKELALENELLLLQLHQVQEELERYFLQYQELANKAPLGSSHSGSNTPTPFSFQPTAVTFDLRREIDGDNWYYAEEDGRWAGPHAVSTIRLPAMAAGRYEVTLDVVDAMAPEIISEMEVSVNGTLIQMMHETEVLPKMVRGELTAESIPQGSIWEFQFKFPKLVSPADRGSEDQRSLAVRLRSISLNALD